MKQDKLREVLEEFAGLIQGFDNFTFNANGNKIADATLSKIEALMKWDEEKIYRFLMDDIEIREANIIVGVGIQDNKKLARAIAEEMRK